MNGPLLCSHQEQHIYLIWNSFVRRISMLVGFTLHCHWPVSLSFNSLIVIAQRWFAWDFYNMFSSIESGKLHNLPDILLWKKYFLCICIVQCCHLQIRSPRSQSTKPPMGHLEYSELLNKLAASVLNDWHVSLLPSTSYLNWQVSIVRWGSCNIIKLLEFGQ